MLLKEIAAALRSLEPLVPLPVIGAEIGVDPAAASLHPYALIGRIDLSLSVEAGIDAAVHPVEPVFEPEIRRARKLVLHPFMRIGKSLPVRNDHILSVFPDNYIIYLFWTQYPLSNARE